ncbi:MAG: copper resistance protein CopC [Nitrospirae bacterium]|nr:copper resistance protein CopC [Candidatus Troglogloeales bacterium]
MKFRIVTGIILLIACAPVKTWAHAFPDHSEPTVGSTLRESPKIVKIWFDSYLESLFSSIEVFDQNQTRIDKKDGQVNEADPTLLSVNLPRLSPGLYTVRWVVVSRDGHKTEGDFKFRIEKP